MNAALGSELAPVRSRVLALAKYGGRAASTRQRLLQYAPYLARHGIDIELKALLDDQYLERLALDAPQSIGAVLKGYLRRFSDLASARRFDAIWLQYEMFPFFPGALERLVIATGVPVVYDIDDAIFHQYDLHRSGLVRAALSSKLKPVLRGASACMCGNQYLRAYTALYCENSIVVPTVVNTDLFRPAVIPASRLTPVVGWIGSPSTWRYVEPLLPTILPLLAERGIRLRVVGAGPRSYGLAGIDAVEWTETAEVTDIQAMDIGIMPVPDNAWTRGKCGYKLIQYMACGLSVIGSPVGVNSQIVTDEVDGLLATTPEQWLAALNRLICNRELRQRFGVAAVAAVKARYSLRSQQASVLSVMQDAIASARHQHSSYP